MKIVDTILSHFLLVCVSFVLCPFYTNGITLNIERFHCYVFPLFAVVLTQGKSICNCDWAHYTHKHCIPHEFFPVLLNRYDGKIDVRRICSESVRYDISQKDKSWLREMNKLYAMLTICEYFFLSMRVLMLWLWSTQQSQQTRNNHHCCWDGFNRNVDQANLMYLSGFCSCFCVQPGNSLLNTHKRSIKLIPFESHIIGCIFIFYFVFYTFYGVLLYLSILSFSC